MALFLIRRIPQGDYVARRGVSHSSYTRKLEWAQLYESREAADADRCKENEMVVPLDAVLGVKDA